MTKFSMPHFEIVLLGASLLCCSNIVTRFKPNGVECELPIIWLCFRMAMCNEKLFLRFLCSDSSFIDD